MQDLKGSKTYDNLLIAYAGESQARNLLQRRRKRDIGRSQSCFVRRRPMKRSMRRSGTSISWGSARRRKIS